MAVVQLALNKVCRGCLSNNNLQPFTRENAAINYAECVGLDVKLDDHLPQQLCVECTDQLNKWIQFKKQCHKTEKTLRSLLASPDDIVSTIKESPEDIVIVPKEFDDSDDQLDIEDSPMVVWLEEDPPGANANQIRVSAPQPILKPPLTSKPSSPQTKTATKNQKKEGITSGLKCEKCGNRFRKLESLEAHQREHDGLLPYVCKDCGKEFRHRLTLRNHMFTHTNESYPCPDCGREFKYPQLVEEHRARIHTKEPGKRFPCLICEWTFTRSQSLQVHMLIHTEERPFKCSLCELTFKSESYLKIHMVRHRTTRDFACDCGKEFVTLSELNFHKRNVHSEDKPHKCDICEKKFTKKSQLETHKKYHKHMNEKDCASLRVSSAAQKRSANVALSRQSKRSQPKRS